MVSFIRTRDNSKATRYLHASIRSLGLTSWPFSTLWNTFIACQYAWRSAGVWHTSLSAPKRSIKGTPNSGTWSSAFCEEASEASVLSVQRGQGFSFLFSFQKTPGIEKIGNWKLGDLNYLMFLPILHILIVVHDNRICNEHWKEDSAWHTIRTKSQLKVYSFHPNH
jgi:hypothetical protein